MGLAADKTILQVGGWLEDEKPSIADTQGFSLSVLFRWLCDVCEARQPTAGLIWIMAQGQAALIHQQRKSSRSGNQLLTSTLPFFPSSHSNLITLWSYRACLMSSVLFTVCPEEFPLSTVMCTDMSACTHAAAVFVYHLEGVRQLSDRWYTLKFQEYTDSCLSASCNYLNPRF